MTLNYFCISIIRQSFDDWTPKFLEDEKQMLDVDRGTCVFFLTVGGFCGSIAAGVVSDFLFEGRRGPVICICTFLLSPCFMALQVVTNKFVLFAIYFTIGFGSYNCS